MLAGAGTLAVPMLAMEPLSDRIKHTDPSKFHRGHSHESAGDVASMVLISSPDMTTNVNFIDHGQIYPGGGVGHHFHNQCEEMFVIFNGEVQYTIDGRTALLKGPGGAPCRMGHSHAIYNHTDKQVEIMNMNISTVKGKYDAFNLGDARVGVPLDPIPVFMTMHLDRNLLSPLPGYLGGQGTALYRRALDPTVFVTNWSYVDHLLLPPGTSEGRHRHTGVEEVYYVMNGSGEVQVNGETAAIAKGDAVPVLLNQVHAFRNNGSEDLEFMIVGIAIQKWVLDTELV